MIKKRRFFKLAHRRIYGEKAINFSLLAIGGLVFAQAFSSKEVSPWLIVLGIILFIVGIVVSYFFLKESKGE